MIIKSKMELSLRHFKWTVVPAFTVLFSEACNRTRKGPWRRFRGAGLGFSFPPRPAAS